MARLNVASHPRAYTHEGGAAFPHMTQIQALRRSVLSCLLWEGEFYESGVAIADRIKDLSLTVSFEALGGLAIEARTHFNLRHVPLHLLCSLIKRGGGNSATAEAIAAVIQRPDEMGELLAMYWADKTNKHMIPAQMRKGLDLAFRKFNEYGLAKYDRDGAVKLRDVLRIVRPKPKDAEQTALWKRVKDRTLATPDTWEVELSGGADKKATFERLIREGKLGYLALLRNLRNMAQAGCDVDLVKAAIIARKGGAERVFPFRYVAAARAAPQFEPALDVALLAAIGEMQPFPGKNVVMVDVSRSMADKLSAKSDLTRMDAAASLAAIMPGDVRMFTFSDALVEVAPRRGMAGVDAVLRSQVHNGTKMFDAIAALNAQVQYDRLIVITDEQAAHPATGFGWGGTEQSTLKVCPDPKVRGYMINVASAKNGVGYGKWTHIDGFSEQVIRFIREVEAE